MGDSTGEVGVATHEAVVAAALVGECQDPEVGPERAVLRRSRRWGGRREGCRGRPVGPLGTLGVRGRCGSSNGGSSWGVSEGGDEVSRLGRWGRRTGLGAGAVGASRCGCSG